MGYQRTNIQLKSKLAYDDEKETLKEIVGRKLIGEYEKKLGKRASKQERDVIKKCGKDYLNKIKNFKKFSQTGLGCIYGYTVVMFNGSRIINIPIFFENFKTALDYVLDRTSQYLMDEERQEVQVNFLYGEDYETEDNFATTKVIDFRWQPIGGYDSPLYTSYEEYTISRIMFAPLVETTLLVPDNNIDSDKELKTYEF